MKELEIQGDVALRVSKLPEGAKKITNRPLALGETSGHAHVVVAEKKADNYELFSDPKTGKTYVSVGADGATLQHMKLATKQKADHNALVLAPNTVYEVILQNEFNPESAAFERVLD
jgi:hypothetical protein